MKASLSTWMDRIDASTLRERALIFFAAAAVVFSLIYSVLIVPTLDGQRALARQIAQRQSETRVLQDQIQIVVRKAGEDPNVVLKRRVDAIKAELAAGEVTLKAREAELVSPKRMTGLIEEMVGRNRHLQVEKLQSLAPVSPGSDSPSPDAVLIEAAKAAAAGSTKTIVAEAGQAAAKGPTTAQTGGAPVSSTKFYRHGVELTIKGSYLELLQFLTELEKIPYRIFWGGLELTTGTYPMATLKIRVYTLSLDKAWMAV